MCGSVLFFLKKRVFLNQQGIPPRVGGVGWGWTLRFTDWELKPQVDRLRLLEYYMHIVWKATSVSDIH